MVRTYTDKQLLDQVKALPDFKGYPKNRWIIGVRSNEDEPDRFDDKFYVYDHKKFVMVMTGTTNPGVSILKKFEQFNREGTAIVKPDNWYYDLWIYGLHRGKIPALLQRGNKISVYRDDNRDEKSDETGKLYSGYFGINFHLNSYNLDSEIKKEYIGNWSAGCQVPNDPKKYKILMDSFKGHSEKITYVLLTEFNP